MKIHAAQARATAAPVKANKVAGVSLAEVVKTASLEVSCFSSFSLFDYKKHMISVINYNHD